MVEEITRLITFNLAARCSGWWPDAAKGTPHWPDVYANGYASRVKPPEVLSFREFRTELAATLRRVQQDDTPVFVGAHRKPEAVLISVSHYQSLVEAAAQREAVTEALASVRAEGLEPSPEGLEMLDAIAAGRMSTAQARERTLARYRR